MRGLRLLVGAALGGFSMLALLGALPKTCALRTESRSSSNRSNLPVHAACRPSRQRKSGVASMGGAPAIPDTGRHKAYKKRLFYCRRCFVSMWLPQPAIYPAVQHHLFAAAFSAQAPYINLQHLIILPDLIAMPCRFCPLPSRYGGADAR